MLFDADGEALAATGPPVRVVQEGEDDAVTPDPDVAAAVSMPVAAALEDAANTVVGSTEVPLNGRRADIRTKETLNLGNLIADALLARARPPAASSASRRSTSGCRTAAASARFGPAGGRDLRARHLTFCRSRTS